MSQSKDNNQLYRDFGPTTFAVNNSTSIFLLTIMILFFGIQSYNTMPKEQFPEIVIPTIYVATTYAGNSAEDMETLVTIPLEKELASITGIKKIDGNSIADFSNIIIEFNTNVTVEKALREVKDAVDKAKGDKDFPKDLTAGPNVFEINFSEFPIMTVNMAGNFSNDELRNYGEYLQTEIEKLPEISEVKLKGVAEKEIQINADWKQMQAKKISFNDIANAIAMENITMSAGERNFNGFNRSVRVVGEFKNVEEIKNIIVKSEFQNPVFLKDVANVVETVADPTSIARSDGLPVVSLDVIKRAGENLLSASDKIKEIVETAKAKKTAQRFVGDHLQRPIGQYSRSSEQPPKQHHLWGDLGRLSLALFLGLTQCVVCGLGHSVIHVDGDFDFKSNGHHPQRDRALLLDLGLGHAGGQLHRGRRKRLPLYE